MLHKPYWHLPLPVVVLMRGGKGDSWKQDTCRHAHVCSGGQLPGLAVFHGLMTDCTVSVCREKNTVADRASLISKVIVAISAVFGSTKGFFALGLHRPMLPRWKLVGYVAVE